MQPDLFSASGWPSASGQTARASRDEAGQLDEWDDFEEWEDGLDDADDDDEADEADGLDLGPQAAVPDVEVRRSARRTRTVSAFWEDGRIVVAIPARLSRMEEKHWVEKMVRQVLASDEVRGVSDGELAERAAMLSRRYVPGAPQPSRITWSTRQLKRWGSCSVHKRTIRIAARVKTMPDYVRDYVIVHELTHLLHRNHGPAFRAVMAGYPEAARAEAFLAGVTFADLRGTDRG